MIQTIIESSKLGLTEEEISLLSAAILMSNSKCFFIILFEYFQNILLRTLWNFWQILDRHGVVQMRLVAEKQTEIINLLRNKISLRTHDPVAILHKVSQFKP